MGFVNFAQCAGTLILVLCGTALAANTPAVNAATSELNTSDSTANVDSLVAAVLYRNPGIAAMRAAVDGAGARVESAGALADPMVSYLVAPNTAGSPRQGLNQNLQVSQAIPWPGTLNLRVHAARAEALSADRLLDDARLRLAATTRGVFAQWYYVHRALAVNAENQKLLNRLEAVAESAYASGQSPQQDVLQAQVELTRLQSQQLELEQQRSVIKSRINTLLDRAADSTVEAPDDLPVPHSLPRYPVLQAAATADYPMLQSLDARLAAGRDQIALAHKNNYPQFELMAGYNAIMDAPAKRLTVGVSINIPFGGNHRGELGEANARVRETQARIEQARSQLLGDLDQAYASATRAEKTIRLYEDKLLPLIHLNLQAAEADYAGGNGDFLKVITAQQQYLIAKLELMRARADLFTQLATLDYQTGGALFHTLANTPTQESRP